MYYTYVDSPVGPFFLAGDGTSLFKASFARGKQRRSLRERARRQTHFEHFATRQRILDRRWGLRMAPEL